MYQTGFVEWLDQTLQSSTFLIIGLIFLGVLIISFVLDGIFEAFDFGDGPLSLSTLGAFGALFGFVGYAATSYGASVELALLVGAGVGLLGAVGAWSLSSFFKKTSSSSSISTASIEGETAAVTLRIPGGESPGEIAYYANGMRNNYIAYSKKAVASGEKVTISSIRGGDSVNVILFKEPKVILNENIENKTDEGRK